MKNINAIFCIDQNFAFGQRGGGMPWQKCVKDLKFFKKMTMNAVLICGRGTAESMPRLPGRYVICCTKMKQPYAIKSVDVFAPSIDEAIKFAQKMDKEIFIIGGAQMIAGAIRAGIITTTYVSQIINKNAACNDEHNGTISTRMIEYSRQQHTVDTDLIYFPRNVFDKYLHKKEIIHNDNELTISLYMYEPCA